MKVHHASACFVTIFSLLVVASPAAPPPQPLAAPGKDLPDGLIELSPAKPTGNWPKSGLPEELAPGRTATITVKVEKKGVGLDGISYVYQSSKVTANSCTEKGLLWTTPPAGIGAYKMVNTSKDKCAANFTATVVWVREGGPGTGEGGTPPPPLTGTANGAVSLLDSLAFFTFDPPATVLNNVMVPVNGVGSNAKEITAFIEFSDTAFRKLSVEVQPVRREFEYVEDHDWLPREDRWILAQKEDPENTFRWDFSVLTVFASIGKVTVDWNDSTAEAKTATEKLNFLRVQILAPGGQEITGRDAKVDLWYFKNGQTFTGYDSEMFGIQAKGLPPVWEPDMRPFIWSKTSGADKFAMMSFGQEADIAVVKPSLVKHDCSFSVVGTKHTIPASVQFGIESFAPARFHGASVSPTHAVSGAWEQVFVYEVPTVLGRFHNVSIPAHEYIYRDTTHVKNTGFAPGAWPVNNWVSLNAEHGSNQVPIEVIAWAPWKSYRINDFIRPDSLHEPAFLNLKTGPPNDPWVDRVNGEWRLGTVHGEGTILFEGLWIRWRDHGRHERIDGGLGPP
jgi:hypothetical protein